jgi:hypothetical protein
MAVDMASDYLDAPPRHPTNGMRCSKVLGDYSLIAR